MAHDNLKNLPPEERIKRLKKIEEEKKKEIAQAEKMIKESQDEITDRRSWLDKVPIPEVATDDSEALGEEGKQLLKTHKGITSKKEKDEKEEKIEEEKDSYKKTSEKNISDLEETLQKDQRRAIPQAYELPHDLSAKQLNSEYVSQLSVAPVHELKERLASLYDSVDKRGYLTWEEHQVVEHTLSALERKTQAIDEGRYSPSQAAANEAVLARQIGAHLLHQEVKYGSSDKGERVEKDWYSGR